MGIKATGCFTILLIIRLRETIINIPILNIFVAQVLMALDIKQQSMANPIERKPGLNKQKHTL